MVTAMRTWYAKWDLFFYSRIYSTVRRRMLKDPKAVETGSWSIVLHAFPLASPSAFSIVSARLQEPRIIAAHRAYLLDRCSQSVSFLLQSPLHNTVNCSGILPCSSSVMQSTRACSSQEIERRGRPIGQAIIVLWVRMQRGWSQTQGEWS
jgi:hypothetical protein